MAHAMAATARTNVNNAVQSVQSMLKPLTRNTQRHRHSRERAAGQDPFNGSVKADLRFVECATIVRKLRFNVEYLGFGLVNLAGQLCALALLSFQEVFVLGLKLPLCKLRGLEQCRQ